MSEEKQIIRIDGFELRQMCFSQIGISIRQEIDSILPLFENERDQMEIEVSSDLFYKVAGYRINRKL